MKSFLGYVGTLVKDVVVSNNKRDVDILHDDNTTKIELDKLKGGFFDVRILYIVGRSRRN